ncbi:hypothetical protein PA7_00380 [Pseudonocardia asaccharolytica DSM 44247 = NBRC 16224]|uniref:UmuC domain-containing protein n=1 Tax=Pseudonocardia asaccharolytica DSM 44247 = NBRC 16224 TaxID=1123024 RepID=A0A511CUH0_9PSEU|nr:hypothetical protein PA7_00380 [Pseudonocardia asaccharolytica DSM 44247 = NBRC 16224]
MAAAEAGVRLERLALVPHPKRELVAVAAALLDGIDLVTVAGAERAGMRAADRQRLMARARQRGAVLLVLGSWPGADLELSCSCPRWQGLGGEGTGRLCAPGPGTAAGPGGGACRAQHRDAAARARRGGGARRGRADRIAGGRVNAGASGSPARVLALWSPDWPVTAAAQAERVPAHRPAAVVVANRVLAYSATARAQGVRRGLRRREAQARCPELAVLTPDAGRDARLFEPVVAAVEELATGVEVIRPGLVALLARGPVGYFGGEQRAAERLVDQVAARTAVECQVGVADGLFAAVLAARRGVSVEPGGTPAFLAPLGVEELDREPEVDRSELVGLLRRLGLRSLGAFGSLPASDVASRFGADAVLAHRLARGLDPRPPVRRRPPEELAVEVELDPPVERVDAAAFAARGLAEQLHRALAGRGLSCTRLGVVAAGAPRRRDGAVAVRSDGGVVGDRDLRLNARYRTTRRSSGAVPQRRLPECIHRP